MIWIDIVVVLTFVFSFLGGVKAGVIHSLFSLLTLIIAITITGFYYKFVVSLFSFLPGEDWENFLGFLFTMVVISIIISVISILPRQSMNSAWNGGGFFRMVGGLFNVANSAIGFVLLMLLLQTYPVMPWLNSILAESIVLTWLITNFDFVGLLLPEAFRGVKATY